MLAECQYIPCTGTLETLIENFPLYPGHKKIIFDSFKKKNDEIEDERLIFDEMFLYPGLYYDIKNGNYIGVEDWGLNKTRNGDEYESTRTYIPADHAIVFMMKSLLTGRKIYIQFEFCRNQTSSA